MRVQNLRPQSVLRNEQMKEPLINLLKSAVVRDPLRDSEQFHIDRRRKRL